MGSAYDRKFEEMKKYIPFLEEMIKRLEITNATSSNPRQAQLDKIRSLRDLLLDKKKRMKMENLLKCEQVLINLYAKVKQRDCLSVSSQPADKSETPATKDSSLQTVRNKLKLVAKTHGPETLPEIARASEIEEVCEEGSKVPALFQRRPNKNSMSPTRSPHKDKEDDSNASQSQSRRSYTRVLLSPDSAAKRWPPDPPTEKPLYSRRSPKKSPRRQSPSHKKERKKSTKESKSRKSKDLNITLNVPEESLNSLNTTDILSRIINCSDNDVDIDTLRGIRSQILGELKETGASEDISDLILKSYNTDPTKKKPEVEEGELSDSETEAIENIYGSLVVVDKDKKSAKAKVSDAKNSKRKIQICLVINKDDANEKDNETQISQDTSEVKMDSEGNKKLSQDTIISIDSDTSPTKPVKAIASKAIKTSNSVKNSLDMSNVPKKSNEQNVKSVEDKVKKIIDAEKEDSNKCSVDTESSENSLDAPTKPLELTSNDNANASAMDNFLPTLKQLEESDKLAEKEKSLTKFTANFYKPLDQGDKEQDDSNKTSVTPDPSNKVEPNVKPNNVELTLKPSNSIESETKNDETKTPAEIPLLNEPTVAPKTHKVSEIDILQALKNEILSETIPIPSPDAVTPALHQPKLIKVASAQEILPKKRISIEKYKQKSGSGPTTSTSTIYSNKPSLDSGDKKQSLKLTEKECERFNLSKRISLDEDDLSDEDLVGETSIDDIYADLAPKSPENEPTREVSTPPVIIPTDPVKAPVVSAKADVDMRSLLPTPQPVPPPLAFPLIPPPLCKDQASPIEQNKTLPPFLDPRMRKELNQPMGINSPNPYGSPSDGTPRSMPFPNIPPLMGSMPPSFAPSYSPSIPPLMPSNVRSYEMTPSRQYEMDEPPIRNHVYAPSGFDKREMAATKDLPHQTEGRQKDGRSMPRWEDSEQFRFQNQKDPRNDNKMDRRDSYSKPDMPLNPPPSFSWSDCPGTPSHPFGRQDAPMTPSHPFGRQDAPMTPSHPFGRQDAPMTPSHPFGRQDAPMTPSHPFGRQEAPMTPSHPFGRQDAPMTPSHPFGRQDAQMPPKFPFGRQDAPMTPSHPFGRLECPTTPIHPFGRSDCPPTPKHPFGMQECPTTPCHPFGRSECPTTPSHPFGRSDSRMDYPPFNKDPRLYRRPPEYESKSYEDKDRDRPKDRDYRVNYYQRYDSPDHSRGYGKESSRRSDRHYQNESGRQYNKESRDRSRGRSVTRDYDDYDRSYQRNRYDRGYEEVGSRRPQRDKVIESDRNMTRQMSPQSRGGRTDRRTDDNTLSVHSHAGRSFTIDTSVNTSFLAETLNDNSFDHRRKRASSVGRSLTRESSVGRSLPRHESVKNVKDTRGKFQRASSVGREILSSGKSKSLKDLKADFEIFKSKLQWKFDSQRAKTDISKKELQYRSRKDNYEKQSNKNYDESSHKQAYSPRKNYRDPRMRREFDDQRHKNDRGSQDRRKSGFVYSSDNLAKGKIIGPALGVKNYKIPKIKRIEPEAPPTPEKSEEVESEEPKTDKTEENQAKDETVKSKDTNKIETKELPSPTKTKAVKKDQEEKPTKVDKSQNELEQKPEQIEDSCKRVTRSSKRLEANKTPESSPIKTRRGKKAVIYDSDENTDTEVIKSPKKNLKTSSPKINTKTNEENVPSIEKSDVNILDSNFGIDDYEIFSGNIATDVNELIAGLDQELSPSKAASIENMIESIDNPEENTLGDISEVIEKDLNESNEKRKESLNDHQIQNITHDLSDLDRESPNLVIDEKVPEISSKLTTPNIKTKQNNSIEKDDILLKTNNDAIVSTTDISQDESKRNHPDPNENKMDTNIESQSLPDSTINKSDVCEKPEDGLPDSTNQVLNETNADVTSTHKEPAETVTSNRDTSQLQSIGNLLSLLQDKTKLKEILSMLSEQSGDSEKIKKKLEKLSEIVSDDDEEVTKDPPTEMKTTEIEATEKSKPETDNIVSNEDILQPKNTDTKGIDKMNISESEISNENVQDDESKSENKSDITIASSNIGTPVDNTDQQSAKDETVNDDKQTEMTNIDDTDKEVIPTQPSPKKAVPKKKVFQRRKGKFKKVAVKKAKLVQPKPLVETADKPKTTDPEKPKVKKSRELQKLQEDIKEMFMSADILNATGIRMCRLAKMVTEKKEEPVAQDTAPVVVLEKVPEVEAVKETQEKVRKKPGPKPKPKLPEKVADEAESESSKQKAKHKPGPKSKQKRDNSDPYEFDTDSVAETNTTKESEDNTSDSEDESLASLRSFSSNEVLADIKKKPRRKRGSWQTGVIKTKGKKKKDQKSDEFDTSAEDNQKLNIPDFNCFTDKEYCYRKQLFTYPCRLCEYTGDEIVSHYKTQHPHTEVPLSRMDPSNAKYAIEQCEDINFQAISKIPSDKYVCRFCYKEFSKKKSALESFFWHVVSMHTGEYKQTCYECVTATRCPFNLDIPPPPKNVRGQLIGYICGKCNFTQISLENLKTHVIVRHNDEQTEVYTINLAVMSKKSMCAMLSRSQGLEKSRTLRSSIKSSGDVTDNQSNVTESENNDDEVDSTPSTSVKSGPLKSKLTFETDEQSEASVKVEQEDEVPDESQPIIPQFEEPLAEPEPVAPVQTAIATPRRNTDQISDHAHFKLTFSSSGTKEYVCCINGVDNHYKTSLLISMKKHVQNKHTENWDGYCSICKAIVTLQGVNCSFKDCLVHYLDKHMDDFPILENVGEPSTNTDSPLEPERVASPKTSFIAVRPIAELISTETEKSIDEAASYPKIENIMSYGNTVEAPQPSPSYPSVEEPPAPEKPFKYEEVQAEVMSNKHSVVLESMMAKEVLVKLYKCAGRFCSFTTDSVEEALRHASTHERVGGEGALDCAYCNFDSSGSAIELVMHVFKVHGRCQYCCGLCFYRAAASQFVGAHFAKAHGSTGKQVVVLRTTVPIPPASDDPPDVLTREAAVPYYVCDAEGCKFRTYIPGKFCEHLKQKHPNETSYSCYLCKSRSPSGASLVQHCRRHGLRLYQCARCPRGEDAEAALVAHAAAAHPAAPPQAYVRIVTTVTVAKSGSKEMRILPLAFLNKSKIAAEDVTPSNVAKNPVREAEKSIELEKLIGHTTKLIESVSTSQPEQAELFDTEPEPLPEVEPEPEREPDPEPEPIPETPATPEPATTLSSNCPKLLSLIREPFVPPPKNIVKTEAVTPPKQQDVICLDSDEEDTDKGQSNSSVLLSDDDSRAPNPPTQNETGIAFKLKCPYCYTDKYRSQPGLLKHVKTCPNFQPGRVTCPHKPCTETHATLRDLFTHFKDHVIKDKVNNMADCGICGQTFPTVRKAKAHVRRDHKSTKLEYQARIMDDGCTTCYTITAAVDKSVKRKTSADGPKRYGIADIDKLPITPILDSLVFCELCEYSTKVRLNMIRHLHLHADKQAVPQTAPVNPVPHLETNEKHFDKMVNLASSSAATRAPDKNQPNVTLMIPQEAASRYPKYVPERQRHTCGARGCSYISVDEGMLRCHWETLHSGTTEYHCVHCPPYQHLDTSKPLTASRIIAHLKMHDVTLYACSSCSYYHYKRQALEKHLTEVHKGGQVMVVREEASSVPPPVPTVSAPTMDLKPWQCGLCSFKSMLRQEVVEHCAKSHQSKMQYKCGYCPFRTSTVENVSKHQSNAHPGKEIDTFYYFYKEGSIPSEADGTPLWQKQRQKSGLDAPDVKPEVQQIVPQDTSTSTSLTVDLNIVKQEAPEAESELSMEELCRKYGQFCEPEGGKYKCCMCNVVEQDREQMQEHLFEELQYRRWGCGLCVYKGYHRAGLKAHMTSEHPRATAAPSPLPTQVAVERWVNALLDHQTKVLSQLSTPVSTPISSQVSTYSDAQLIEAFGPFGSPVKQRYRCPKCCLDKTDESEMTEHLTAELNKIRWCCTHCSEKFQSYHEAQFHCKFHQNSARPKESLRDPVARSAWVSAVIRTQKQGLSGTETAQTLHNIDPNEENSLLVVRYEEPVPETGPTNRRRPASRPDPDEPPAKRPNRNDCPHCEYASKYKQCLKEHILKHYGLKGFTCSICQFNGTRKGMAKHVQTEHPGLPARPLRTPLPAGPPPEPDDIIKKPEVVRKVCLQCRKSIPETVLEGHVHDNTPPGFAVKGDVVVKCSICDALRSNVADLEEHHRQTHPNCAINYEGFRLDIDTRDKIKCVHCGRNFFGLKDLKAHHNKFHYSLFLIYTVVPYVLDDADMKPVAGMKRKGPTPPVSPKRIARKSTTKLPNRTVAKKSTTKLPIFTDSDSESDAEGVSYYGTKPDPLEKYNNLTMSMPMGNVSVPINVTMLGGIIKFDQKIVLKDFKR